MSSRGYRDIELEKQRKEQLRIERLRNQAHSLLDSCSNQINSIKEPAIQQLIASELKEVLQEIKKVSALVDSDPDAAISHIKNIQDNLQNLLAGARQKASNLTKEQSEAKTRLELLRQNLKAEQQTANEASIQELERASREINKAEHLCIAGKFKDTLKACDEAEGIIKEAGKKAFDETVRREVVKGLIATLTGMGFITDNPVLEGDGCENSKVRLTGTLPSGKRAAFLINLDGKMEFDFDGYQGRGCAKEMERIESQLNERFSIKLGPAQVTWKNPDKLAKGAVNLPASNSISNF